MKRFGGGESCCDQGLPEKTTAEGKQTKKENKGERKKCKIAALRSINAQRSQDIE